jgi:FkbM family methyltransferase
MAQSLPQRFRSLVRRSANWLDWHIGTKLVSVLYIKNWWTYVVGSKTDTAATYRLRCGFNFTVPALTTDINPFTDVWIRRVYDSNVIDWNAARTIIDIGGHTGAFALYAAWRSPQAKIYSYEPEPVSFSFLQRNIRESNLEHRVTGNNFAVGKESGTAVLHVLPGRGEGNSMFRSSPQAQDISVPVTRLQDIFQKENIDHCDILKLNAEGVEYEILYSLHPEILKRISVIVMNYHVFVPDPRATPDQLRAYLEANNFAVTEQGKRIFVAVQKG